MSFFFSLVVFLLFSLVIHTNVADKPMPALERSGRAGCRLELPCYTLYLFRNEKHYALLGRIMFHSSAHRAIRSSTNPSFLFLKGVVKNVITFYTTYRILNKNSYLA
jgi:hypothetical protein